jgi:diguanylate cyclase (GGDEF)-like protein/PAS domain S-box-containing protein
MMQTTILSQRALRAVTRRWALSDIILGALATIIPSYVVWVLFVGSTGQADATRYAVSLLVYGFVGGAAAVFAYRASRQERLPARVRDGWSLLALALGLSWVGYLIYSHIDDILAPLPLPLIANLIFLAFYVVTFLALPCFTRVPATRLDMLKLLLDAAMIVIPSGLVLWRLMLDPVALRGESDSLRVAYSISFALCDLVILAGLATLLVHPRRVIGERPLRILALGMVLYVIGDVLLARLTLAGQFWSGGLPNAFWISALGLFGLAADVQRREASQGVSQGAGTTAAVALAPANIEAPASASYRLLPYVAVAVSYALLLADALARGDLSWTIAAVAAATLTCCLVVRHMLVLRENERLLADRVRREGDLRLSSLARYSRDVVTIVGQDGRMSYASPSVARLLGHEPAALDAVSILTLVYPPDEPAVRALLADALANQDATLMADVRLVHANGSLRDCELIALSQLADPNVQGIVVTCHDMTEHRAFERELTDLAINDRLTGLPNRTLLQDRLSQAMARAQRRGTSVATLLVDLDNFKVINDSLGHQTGDELLILVAERVAACLRSEDTLARMGGDEMAILMEEAVDEASVIAVAACLIETFSAPFHVRGQSLYTSASIGIALSGPAVDQPASLLRNADLAMYQAKARGKARWALFDPGLNDAMHERLELETELRGALENGAPEHGSLWVAYQPVVDVQTGVILEVEALIRWQHPKHGLISPARFIPIAEETGLIVQIGRWVLEQACQQAALWQAARTSGEPIIVGVNLSGRQLQAPGLVEMVADVLATSGLAGSALKLELTESVVMESTATTIEMLTRLKALGVRLAIDDFGTGYSSLAYLKRFPVDVLKIDRSFVAGLGRDPHDTAIVQGVIAMAQGLGMTVTAEGVETAEQVACLKRLGCDLAQGYFYAQPLAPECLGEMLTVRCSP